MKAVRGGAARRWGIDGVGKAGRVQASHSYVQGEKSRSAGGNCNFWKALSIHIGTHMPCLTNRTDEKQITYL